MADLSLGDTQLLITTCKVHGLLRNQAAYVLASCYWESARTMRPVKEAFWLSEGWRERNLRYYPWYGRGHIQTTWESNYVRAKDEIGVDFVANPELALEPEHSVVIAVRGCKEGWFTGARLDEFITLQKSDFQGARVIVNGTDRAATIAALAEDYDAALLEDGYGVEVDEPPAPSAKDLLGAYINHKDVVPGSPQHTIAGALRDME